MMHTVERLLTRQPRLGEAAQRIRFRWRHRSRARPVLVHQMARVGSVTVIRALRARFPDANLFHTHYLHPATIAEYRSRFRRLRDVTGRPGLHREFMAAELLHRSSALPRPWRVVSLVRDPMARIVSAFFKHFDLNHPELGTDFLQTRNVQSLIELFLGPEDPECDFALRWFDHEVRDVLDIDVFATPFPRPKGFQTYSSRAADLLLLRLEDLNRVGADALGAFFETEPIALEHQNRSRDAGYGATFAAFKAALRVPPAYLDAVYSSALATHFYTEDEIDALRERWSA